MRQLGQNDMSGDDDDAANEDGVIGSDDGVNELPGELFDGDDDVWING